MKVLNLSRIDDTTDQDIRLYFALVEPEIADFTVLEQAIDRLNVDSVGPIGGLFHQNTGTSALKLVAGAAVDSLEARENEKLISAVKAEVGKFLAEFALKSEGEEAIITLRDARQSSANCKSELSRSGIETPKSMMSVLGQVEDSIDHVVRGHLFLPLGEQLTATVNDWNSKAKAKAAFTDTDISVAIAIF